MLFRNKTWVLVCASLIFFALCQILSFIFKDSTVCNVGIGLGFVIPKPATFLLISVFFTVVVLFVRKTFQDKNKTPKFPFILGEGFLLGGAISNIAERLLWGCVRDYFHISFFPMFNLADIGISAGILFLIFSILKEREIEQ